MTDIVVINKGTYIRSGNICGDKILFKDGVGYSVWLPFPNDETAGLCWDIEESDIDSLIAVLKHLRNSEPTAMAKYDAEEDKFGEGDIKVNEI